VRPPLVANGKGARWRWWAPLAVRWESTATGRSFGLPPSNLKDTERQAGPSSRRATRLRLPGYFRHRPICQLQPGSSQRSSNPTQAPRAPYISGAPWQSWQRATASSRAVGGRQGPLAIFTAAPSAVGGLSGVSCCPPASLHLWGGRASSPGETEHPHHRGHTGNGQQPVPEHPASDRTSRPPFWGLSLRLSLQTFPKPLAAWAKHRSSPCSLAPGPGLMRKGQGHAKPAAPCPPGQPGQPRPPPRGLSVQDAAAAF